MSCLTSFLRDRPKPEVATGQLFACDDHIAMLASANAELRGVVRDDEHDVAGDHFEGVVVDHGAEVLIGGGVDEAQPVPRACLESC